MPKSGWDLYLASPWMNAAGSLGYAPPARWPLQPAQGAFVTHPLSLRPRRPAEARTLIPYPGGFLLHTGWPNPGFREALPVCRTRWAQAGVPVWVHLLGSSPADIDQMVRELEGCENVAAVELSLPPHASPGEMLEMIAAGVGELPLVVSLPLDNSQHWWGRMISAGVSAVTISAPRGTLMSDGALVSGRLYGPALLPQTLRAVRSAAGLGLPVIAGCGVFSQGDGEMLLRAGAWAVQVDALLWL